MDFGSSDLSDHGAKSRLLRVMTDLVSLKNVTLHYPSAKRGLRSLLRRGGPQRKALDAVDLSLKRGDRLALVGLNGSGKSTLLRVMAGIYPPQSGSVSIKGTTAALFNLGIGMRMELSGRRNIALQGLVHGHSMDSIRALTPGIIEFSELEAVIDDPINTYSQGMAMRLSFAVATALKPDILLLDEWIGAGDRVFREKANERLLSLVADSSGFVLASHNTTLVRLHCNRAAWLDNGVMRMNGLVDEVIDAFESETDHNAPSALKTALSSPYQ
jgi:ABC-type polysaccharide/polyol phosphate transport system ATPase subunit